MDDTVETPEQQQKAREEGWMHARFGIKGLEKLPDWTGNTYRGVGFTPAEIARRYPVGGITKMEAFTSTSVNRVTAESFASQNTSGDKIGLLLNMRLTKGKDVKPFANIPREGEILVLPFSTFTVRSMNDRRTPGGTRYKEANLQQTS